MRNCAGCGVSLTIGNTYAGIKKWCRACWCARTRERRRTNPAVREHDRVRAGEPERRARAAIFVREWQEKNPHKLRAHKAVYKAVQDGTLEKQPCERCGSSENLNAHHDDYSQPLSVEWLCSRCHHRHHAALRAG